MVKILQTVLFTVTPSETGDCKREEIDLAVCAVCAVVELVEGVCVLLETLFSKLRRTCGSLPTVV